MMPINSPNTSAHTFAHTFAKTLSRMEADSARQDAVYWAARFVSDAVTLGYACIDLADLPNTLCFDLPEAARIWITKPDEWAKTLLLSKAVFDTEKSHQPAPLCLDNKNRLYLYRYWHAEKVLAFSLARRLQIPPVEINKNALIFIDALFGPSASDQKQAVLTALTYHFSIITGGPGTGKTHTMVAFLMASLLSNPNYRIRLLAPTGKAAARMQESIDTLWSSMLQKMPDGYQQKITRENIPSPMTVHRFLNKKPFDLRARKPVLKDNIDLLIVDEASMLDLMLAYDLLSCLPDETQVLFIGDANQLVSVDAGELFSECAALNNLKTGVDLPDFIATLKENYRFGKDSHIGRLANIIVSDQPEALAHFYQTHQETRDLRLCQLNDPVINEIIQAYRPLIDHIIQHPDQLDSIFNMLNSIKVITSTYQGAYGVDRINDIMMTYLHQRYRTLSAPISAMRHYGKYYPGQLIMITQNQTGFLYNGQIGIIIQKEEASLAAVFQRPDQSGFLHLMPTSLPAHETAFAMTVHKTQGSEFEHAIVLLPDYARRLLTRRLLYTAVTRAKQRLTLAADLSTLTDACQNKDHHTSAISDHILSIFTSKQHDRHTG